jgi:hypothetical protein
MRLFKKRVVSLSAGQEQRAGKIAGSILKGQRKAADYLNRKAAGMPGGRLLFLLIAFCLAFGGYCLYLVIQPFIL